MEPTGNTVLPTFEQLDDEYRRQAMKLIDREIRKLRGEDKHNEWRWKLSKQIVKVFPPDEAGTREALYIDQDDKPHTAWIDDAEQVIIAEGW